MKAEGNKALPQPAALLGVIASPGQQSCVPLTHSLRTFHILGAHWALGFLSSVPSEPAPLEPHRRGLLFLVEPPRPTCALVLQPRVSGSLALTSEAVRRGDPGLGTCCLHGLITTWVGDPCCCPASLEHFRAPQLPGSLALQKHRSWGQVTQER